MQEIKEYRLIVHFESDHMWAQVAELPGCFASGQNFDELREALEEALTLCLAGESTDCRVEITDFAPKRAVKKVPIRAHLVHA